MKAVFLDLARTVVEFSPGYHNELGSFLRSNGYCISDRDVFREIAKQRAWLHVAPDCQDNLALDFASLGCGRIQAVHFVCIAYEHAAGTRNCRRP